MVGLWDQCLRPEEIADERKSRKTVKAKVRSLSGKRREGHRRKREKVYSHVRPIGNQLVQKEKKIKEP